MHTHTHTGEYRLSRDWTAIARTYAESACLRQKVLDNVRQRRQEAGALQIEAQLVIEPLGRVRQQDIEALQVANRQFVSRSRSIWMDGWMDGWRTQLLQKLAEIKAQHAGDVKIAPHGIWHGTPASTRYIGCRSICERE